MSVPTKTRDENHETCVSVFHCADKMGQQEELNRQFISAISTLEATAENLRNEITDVKKSVSELVKQMVQIKLLIGGIVFGLVLNANPNDWVHFLKTLLSTI